ncbi:MAG: phosphotransferase [Parvibaculaceae bacterium]
MSGTQGAETEAREALLRAFLENAGWDSADRTPFPGDASLRRYERISRDGEIAVLMDWPPGPDAPVGEGHAAYSKLAHLAEDVRPFVAVGNYLRGIGLRAPEVFAADLGNGFLLLEDLGLMDFGSLIERGEGPAGETLDDMYRSGIDALVILQRSGAPGPLPVGDGTSHTVPAFDDGIYRIETAMPLDWYLPVVMGREASGDLRAEYDALWTALWPVIEQGPRTLFLRDFHSPNILWQSGAAGVARVGLIDYQDALIGSLAYDPVSFLQDARRDVPAEREAAMLRYYMAEKRGEDAAFNAEAFEAAYAVLGAERALRLMGLWPRLLKRDGKPQYMAHMARTMDYLHRNLAHPALEDLAAFVKKHFLDGAPEPGKTAGEKA